MRESGPTEIAAAYCQAAREAGLTALEAVRPLRPNYRARISWANAIKVIAMSIRKMRREAA